MEEYCCAEGGRTEDRQECYCSDEIAHREPQNIQIPILTEQVLGSARCERVQERIRSKEADRSHKEEHACTVPEFFSHTGSHTGQGQSSCHPKDLRPKEQENIGTYSDLKWATNHTVFGLDRGAHVYRTATDQTYEEIDSVQAQGSHGPPQDAGKELGADQRQGTSTGGLAQCQGSL